MTNPLVSVIMPVYNANKIFFSLAVRSILNQTYKNLELIIVDDGSLKKVVIDEFHDDRIKIVRFQINKGISNALNYGISISNGEYIARMDSDDISHKTRFEQQLVYLKKHPIISSNVYEIDEQGNPLSKSKKLIFHDFVRKFQLYRLLKNPVNHPTIIAHKEVFNLYKYDSDYDGIEDLELWLRMSKRYKIYFDSNYVLDYRINKKSIYNERETKLKNLKEIYIKR